MHNLTIHQVCVDFARMQADPPETDHSRESLMTSTFGWMLQEFRRFSVFWILLGFWVAGTIAVSTMVGDPMLPAVLKYALRTLRALVLLPSLLSLSVAISFL